MNNTTASSAVSAPGLYGAVWRWHFYAGLFVAPFMVLLAVTGALYLFNTEIEERWYARLMKVEPAADIRGVPEQQAAVLAAYPGAKIGTLQLPRREDLASEWSITTVDGRDLGVFVDPYRAAVQGELDSNWRLMNVVSDLHGEIMVGRVGDTLIELAACWAFVLVVTGLYLWWPRGAGLAGTLIPRLGARGRVFWRDLHAVPAFWSALLLGFLILSGLPWSGFWGDQLAQLGTLSNVTQPTPNFMSAPPSPSVAPGKTARAGHSHGADAREELPWALRKAPVPASREMENPIGIAQVMQHIEAAQLRGPRLRVFYPGDARGVYIVSHIPAQAQGQRTLYIDQYSGEVIQDTAWSQYSMLGKAVEWGVMTHLGRQFGLINQLIGLLVCVLITLTAVTGVVMWWQRRPKGILGAPSLPKSYRTTRTVVLITLSLSILFPLVGASLVLVLGLEGLLRHLKPAQQAHTG